MLQTEIGQRRAGGTWGGAVAVEANVPEKRLGSQEGRKRSLGRRNRRQTLHHCLEQPQSPSNQSPDRTRVVTRRRVPKMVQRQRVMIPPSSKRFMMLRRFRACSITTWRKVRVSLCNEPSALNVAFFYPMTVPHDCDDYGGTWVGIF